MKKFFLPIFAVLLVLGSILPLAAYRVTRAVLSGAEPASSAVSSPAASAQPPSAVPSADARQRRATLLRPMVQNSFTMP